MVNLRNDEAWGIDKGIDTLIDGHCRVLLALRKSDEQPVPYFTVDLTPDEERIVLASYDPIGAMAVPDREKYAELVQAVESEDESILALLKACAGDTPMPAEESYPTEEPKTITCPECGAIF
jgi:hypothetical protein